MANGSRIRISTTSVRGSCKKTVELEKLKHDNLGLKRLKSLEVAKKQALRMKRIPGLCRDLFSLNAFVHSEGDGRQSVRVHLGLVLRSWAPPESSKLMGKHIGISITQVS